MKQLFFFELKQNVTKDFFKKYLYGEKVKKVFSLNTVVDRSLHICASVFKINNSFAVKNDKYYILKISTTRATLTIFS